MTKTVVPGGNSVQQFVSFPNFLVQVFIELIFQRLPFLGRLRGLGGTESSS